jgi:tetratricopeptide (TPR) repeat protein
MSEQVVAPAEAVDPFEGKEVSFEEFSNYRKTGEVPERIKAEAPKEPPVAQAETVDGEEPAKEAEQEKAGPDRDDQGKFRKKVEFSPEQQEVLNREIKRAKEKARREAEQQYTAKTSVTQATAAEVKPENAATAESAHFNPDGSPKEPKPPKHPGKLRDYPGTIEEYDTALEEFDKAFEVYPAQKAAFIEATRQYSSRKATVDKRLADSWAKASKAFPDYAEKFAELSKDVSDGIEPSFPVHVNEAINSHTLDPFAVNYFLLTHNEEYRKLAAISSFADAIAEVKEIEFKLRQSPAPDKKPAPPKPKPPSPVSGAASATAFDVSDTSLSPDEWAKLRNEQLAKRRGR